MKIKTMLGLAAIGGLLYAHRRRGGEWTVESLKRSASDLLGFASEKAREVQTHAADRTRDLGERLEDTAQHVHP